MAKSVPTATSATSTFTEKLDAFDRAVELATAYYPSEEIDSLSALRDKAQSRLRHGTSLTVVAIAGATGSGKSSIVNRLAGTELTKSSVRRPTTSATHAVVWGDEDAGPLLDWLEISHRYQVESAADGSTTPLDGLVLLDLPDHDSTAVEHRIEVDRLVELVDVLVWVTDPQKYADAALHLGYIQPLAQHADILRFVLNQVDRLDDGGASVMADFGRLVSEDGIAGAQVLPVSALTGAGFDRFEQELATAIAERNAALVRVDADLNEAAAAMRFDGAFEDPDGKIRKDLIAGLGEAAGSEAAADVAVRHHVRQGSLAMGWPFTRWLRRLARKPLADLPGPGRTGAAEPRADLALRDYAEAVAGTSDTPWPGAVRTAAFGERDALLNDLRSTVGREAVNAGSKPKWWMAVSWLQGVLAITAIVGLVWLVTVAILGGFFQFDTGPLLPPTPEAERIPLPSALLIGGVILGLLVALLSRIPLNVGAARRGRSARKAIERQIVEHAEARVLEPVRAVAADRETIVGLLTSQVRSSALRTAG